MKLSEFIYNKIGRRFWVSLYREEDIEKWIVDWYESEFRWQGKKKRPPMWLADWKQFVQPERSVVEQERCGIDEG